LEPRPTSLDARIHARRRQRERVVGRAAVGAVGEPWKKCGRVLRERHSRGERTNHRPRGNERRPTAAQPDGRSSRASTSRSDSPRGSSARHCSGANVSTRSRPNRPTRLRVPVARARSAAGAACDPAQELAKEVRLQGGLVAAHEEGQGLRGNREARREPGRQAAPRCRAAAVGSSALRAGRARWGGEPPLRPAARRRACRHPAAKGPGGRARATPRASASRPEAGRTGP